MVQNEQRKTHSHAAPQQNDAPPPNSVFEQVLQNELRKTHAKSQALEWIEELVLFEIVGKGGFGVVYKGTWKGSIAAVKVEIVCASLCV